MTCIVHIRSSRFDDVDIFILSFLDFSLGIVFTINLYGTVYLPAKAIHVHSVENLPFEENSHFCVGLNALL